MRIPHWLVLKRMRISSPKNEALLFYNPGTFPLFPWAPIRNAEIRQSGAVAPTRTSLPFISRQQWQRSGR